MNYYAQAKEIVAEIILPPLAAIVVEYAKYKMCDLTKLRLLVLFASFERLEVEEKKPFIQKHRLIFEGECVSPGIIFHYLNYYNPFKEDFKYISFIDARHVKIEFRVNNTVVATNTIRKRFGIFSLDLLLQPVEIVLDKIKECNALDPGKVVSVKNMWIENVEHTQVNICIRLYTKNLDDIQLSPLTLD